jgi:acyl dehydratase
MTTSISYDELPTLSGRDLGHSSWIDVDQKRIDTFADATDDHQWIHVDPERAQGGPFGTTIAHGYLTLALVIPLWSELLDVEGVTTKVNYGLNSVRFPAPVPSGAKIRLGATVAEVTEIRGGFQLTVDAVVESDAAEKPVCVAQLVLRFYA